jgi:hypothetical protein
MRGLLSLLARVGPTTIRRSELAAHLSREAQAALRAAGVLRTAPLARSYACGDPGAHDCAREVIACDDDGPTPYVARCARSDDPCPAVDVTADDLAQVSVSLDALSRALTKLLALEALPGSVPPNDPLAPRLLGSDASARDVFLAIPTAPDRLALWLATRAHAARPSTVFIATADLLSPDLFTRHAPGAHVELARLDDLLRVRDNALALAPRLRIVRAPAAAPAPAPAPSPARPGAPRALPPLSTWRDLRIYLVDGETVLLQIGDARSRRSYVDFGLASKANRKARKPWRLLVAICEGSGKFTWRNFGDFDVAKRLVADLRIVLRRELGLADDPFEPFTAAGWRAKFTAFPVPPEDLAR